MKLLKLEPCDSIQGWCETLECCTSDVEGFVFEIYPAGNDSSVTRQVRIGFNVADIDTVFARVVDVGAVVRTQPTETVWGCRAVVQDFEGRTIELLTAHDR